MVATLLAVVIALAIGHLAPGIAARLRQYGWYRSWLRWLDAHPATGRLWRGSFAIALALLPPLLLTGLLQFALDKPVWGLVGLLFDIVVLFHCWGPRDLDLDVAAVLDAPDAAARRSAAAALWPAGETASLDGPSLVEAVFRNALRRWFGVLFWFCLLGPFGALLYRLSALAAEREDAPRADAASNAARTWRALLEWPVTQLMVLALALVGNLGSVRSAWREDGAFGLDGSLLGTAARASVRSEIAEEVADYADTGVSAAMVITEVFGELPELRDAMSLAWRILVLWLVVIALLVIAGWVG